MAGNRTSRWHVKEGRKINVSTKIVNNRPLLHVKSTKMLLRKFAFLCVTTISTLLIKPRIHSVLRTEIKRQQNHRTQTDVNSICGFNGKLSLTLLNNVY